MDNNTILTVTPKIEELSSLCLENSKIDPELYTKYNVQRGLRDLQGRGVLAGLTNISNIISSVEKDGKMVPCDGVLLYRGIDVRDIVKGFIKEDRLGFEETAYLLLFGRLPSAAELQGQNLTYKLCSRRCHEGPDT